MGISRSLNSLAQGVARDGVRHESPRFRGLGSRGQEKDEGGRRSTIQTPSLPQDLALTVVGFLPLKDIKALRATERRWCCNMYHRGNYWQTRRQRECPRPFLGEFDRIQAGRGLMRQAVRPAQLPWLEYVRVHAQEQRLRSSLGLQRLEQGRRNPKLSLLGCQLVASLVYLGMMYYAMFFYKEEMSPAMQAALFSEALPAALLIVYGSGLLGFLSGGVAYGPYWASRELSYALRRYGKRRKLHRLERQEACLAALLAPPPRPRAPL